jgi:hypothetical protein
MGWGCAERFGLRERALGGAKIGSPRAPLQGGGVSLAFGMTPFQEDTVVEWHAALGCYRFRSGAEIAAGDGAGVIVPEGAEGQAADGWVGEQCGLFRRRTLIPLPSHVAGDASLLR